MRLYYSHVVLLFLLLLAAPLVTGGKSKEAKECEAAYNTCTNENIALQITRQKTDEEYQTLIQTLNHTTQLVKATKCKWMDRRDKTSLERILSARKDQDAVPQYPRQVLNDHSGPQASMAQWRESNPSNPTISIAPRRDPTGHDSENSAHETTASASTAVASTAPAYLCNQKIAECSQMCQCEEARKATRLENAKQGLQVEDIRRAIKENNIWLGDCLGNRRGSFRRDDDLSRLRRRYQDKEIETEFIKKLITSCQRVQHALSSEKSKVFSRQTEWMTREPAFLLKNANLPQTSGLQFAATPSALAKKVMPYPTPSPRAQTSHLLSALYVRGGIDPKHQKLLTELKTCNQEVLDLQRDITGMSDHVLVTIQRVLDRNARKRSVDTATRNDEHAPLVKRIHGHRKKMPEAEDVTRLEEQLEFLHAMSSEYLNELSRVRADRDKLGLEYIQHVLESSGQAASACAVRPPAVATTEYFPSYITVAATNPHYANSQANADIARPTTIATTKYFPSYITVTATNPHYANPRANATIAATQYFPSYITVTSTITRVQKPSANATIATTQYFPSYITVTSTTTRIEKISANATIATTQYFPSYITVTATNPHYANSRANATIAATQYFPSYITVTSTITRDENTLAKAKITKSSVM